MLTDRDALMPDDRRSPDPVTAGGDAQPSPRPSLQVAVAQYGGAAKLLYPTPSRLSGLGLSFTHRHYVHEGSVCVVCLTDRHGATARVPARIACCRHQGGFSHEVTIAFDEPIDPAEYQETLGLAGAVAAAEAHGEHAAEPGAVLFDPDMPDRRLVTYWLEQLGYAATLRSSIDPDVESLRELLRGARVLVIDDRLVTLALPRQLREAGFTGRAIVLTEHAAGLAHWPEAVCLMRPVTPRTLRTAVERETACHVIEPPADFGAEGGSARFEGETISLAAAALDGLGRLGETLQGATDDEASAVLERIGSPGSPVVDRMLDYVNQSLDETEGELSGMRDVVARMLDLVADVSAAEPADESPTPGCASTPMDPVTPGPEGP